MGGWEVAFKFHKDARFQFTFYSQTQTAVTSRVLTTAARYAAARVVLHVEQLPRER
jgi:hypothetical protein